MNLLGVAATVYLPGFARMRGLRTLFEITASAFGTELPSLRNRSYAQSLEAYARFTKAQVDVALDRPSDLEPVRRRLFENGFHRGQQLRRLFHISTMHDVMKVCKVLYGCIGITFEGDRAGGITIRDCYFSKFYSSRACELISCLDQGLVAGLSDGDKLQFSGRITEGMHCCSATLTSRN